MEVGKHEHLESKRRGEHSPDEDVVPAEHSVVDRRSDLPSEPSQVCEPEPIPPRTSDTSSRSEREIRTGIFARFGECTVQSEVQRALGFVGGGSRSMEIDSGGANVPEYPLVSTSRDWLSGTPRFPE